MRIDKDRGARTATAFAVAIGRPPTQHFFAREQLTVSSYMCGAAVWGQCRHVHETNINTGSPRLSNVCLKFPNPHRMKLVISHFTEH
ncbi:hypothetical protein QYE47_02585 [Pseudomonas sp. 2,4-D]|uniref:hypothetical protein n=1 Tax=Pseudomonas sp. 2,4-D TaxID=3058433 RepID=UPI0026045482|nr:hypothetical protein [Pseudomonas sp. 2,4-D]MDN4511395.1 hypothetical protein [Pseudomonas sp. 2,4-D]